MSEFQPITSACYEKAFSAVEAKLTLPGNAVRSGVVSIINEGPDPVYVEFGGSTVAAVAPVLASGAAGSMKIPVGPVPTIITMAPGWTTMSGICRAGKTATVSVTLGAGS